MTVKDSWDFGRIGTTQGELKFGDVTKNNTKFSASLRSSVPGQASDHYIGLAGYGKFAGSTFERSPSMHSIYCGTTPVDGQAFLLYAENGDVMIGAPQGRVRIWAKDIDLIASGGSNDRGFVNIQGSSKVEVFAGKEVNLTAQTQIGMTAPRQIALNTSGLIKLAGAVKFLTPASLSIPPPGTNTIKDTIEGYKKLINSLFGG